MTISELSYTPRVEKLFEIQKSKILILDGAMGTMIMKKGLRGCNDYLSVTHPDVIYDIHRGYLEAGADIIETNSFNCNKYSLSEYGLSYRVEEIAKSSAVLARQAVEDYEQNHPGRTVWVAGSVGPSGKSLSLAASLEANDVSWDELEATFYEQIRALIEGGVDIIAIETVFDSLNAKCAAHAARRAMIDIGVRVPLMISATLTENKRLLTGMTLEAFITAISHVDPWAITLNCGFGPEGMKGPISSLQDIPCLTGIYPNAGLPDEMGEYNETPCQMVEELTPLLQKRMLNILGGCCGTTPEHINEISKLAAKFYPREIPDGKSKMVLSGQLPLEVTPENNFVNIGERCNVAGSRKFLRIIKECDMEQAVGIAREQIESGSRIIDINMDDSMIDAETSMKRFLDAVLLDPIVSEVPFMIDSSNHKVITSALKLIPGRAIVNSISLKEGEEMFVQKALDIKELGAAVVVMAFDEKGQAVDNVRRLEIFSRAYDILTSDKVGFKPSDIIFDPNVLAVSTGLAEHDRFAFDFLESVTLLRNNFPEVKISGGISNLSFAFRGNNKVREAMHSIFLSHAIKRGMDMAIVNAAAIPPVDDIPQGLFETIEAVLVNSPGKESTEKLIEVATTMLESKEDKDTVVTTLEDKHNPLSIYEKIESKVIKGDASGLEALLSDAMSEGDSAISVINGPLMDGMNRVGEMFGAGRMFLPQVVKSAGVMKHAVNYLTPFIENSDRNSNQKRRMILATVKGDVHDIGKNIVAVIMKCNGWDVIDLGVMVEPEKIIDEIRKWKADAVGVSGLITPSLEEMKRLAVMLEESGMTLPLFVGGATTSSLHTAVKIAPSYPSGVTVHTSDASMMPAIAKSLTESQSDLVREDIRTAQKNLRTDYEKSLKKKELLTLEEARNGRIVTTETPIKPNKQKDTLSLTIEEVSPYINWRAFVDAWSLSESRLKSKIDNSIDAGKYSSILIEDAKRVLGNLSDMNARITARVAILPVIVNNESVLVKDGDYETLIELPRRLIKSPIGVQPSLADFLNRSGDWMGMFVVTTSGKITSELEKLKEEGNDYEAMLLGTVADRLVEAATEVMHYRVRTRIWGYSDEQSLDPSTFMKHEYQGIRPAIGYPSLPDQLTVFKLDDILHYGDVGVRLTENGALYPQATTTGLLFSSSTARYFSVK